MYHVSLPGTSKAAKEGCAEVDDMEQMMGEPKKKHGGIPIEEDSCAVHCFFGLYLAVALE